MIALPLDAADRRRARLFIRSVFPDSEGFAIQAPGAFLSDHRSPLKQRWWVVRQRHARLTSAHRHQLSAGKWIRRQLDTWRGANQSDLSPFVNSDPYLSPHSDIVPLMVLEHQARAQNLIFPCYRDAN